MTFYRYSQNNSGGSFLAPALEVFVEADSPKEADEIALRNGLYFDGENGEYEYDCDCCGPRWYKADKWTETYSEEAEIPMPYLHYDEWADEGKVPVRKIFRKA